MSPIAPMAPETRTGPAPTADRVPVIDVLRGLALLGMIVVHFHDHTVEDAYELLRTAVWRLVENKSHGTFALLFGAGFALQVRRAVAADVPFAARMLRRLLVLAVIGTAAHACCGFNVLLGYAIWGVPLVLLGRASSRTLAGVAIGGLLVPALFWLSVDWGLLPAPDIATGMQVRAALAAAAQQPDYWPLLVARLHHMAWFYTQPFFVLPGATLLLFALGMLAVRHRVFEQPLAHRRWLLAFALFGLLAWAVATWLPPEFQLIGVLRDQWLTFTYVGGALLLAGRWPQVVAALRPIGVAGRMALTNYLLQIVVLDVLFSGYGLHVQPLRERTALLAAALLFAGLVALSCAWMARHRHGPVEWLWRSLTYRRAQPWRGDPAERPRAARRPVWG
jgi:uncharacterized protein